MAITFPTTPTNDIVGSGTQITITEPSGAGVDDIIQTSVYAYNSGSYPSLGTPTGWTKQHSIQYNSGSDYNEIGVYWIRRGASAPSLVFTRSAGTNYMEAHSIRIDGCRTTGDPFTSAAVSTVTSAANIDPPSVPTSAGEVVLCGGFIESGRGGSAWTAPSGYTIDGSGSTGEPMVTAYKSISSGSSENPGAFSGAASTANQFGWSWSLTDSTGTAYTLPADAGSFTETGVAVALQKTSNITASTGTFVLTGQNATLNYSGNPASTYTLTAQLGQFIQNGYDVNLVYSVPNFLVWDRVTGNEGYRIEWGQTSGGPYPNSSDNTTNDETITLTLEYRTTWYVRVAALVGGVPQDWAPEIVFTSGIPDLNPEVGVFSLTGNTIGLAVGRNVVANSGAYTLTGITAALSVARALVTETATFTYTGNDVNLVYSPTGQTYTLVADVGAFTFTGIEAGVAKGYNLPISVGTFLVSGVNNGLIYSGNVSSDTIIKILAMRLGISL